MWQRFTLKDVRVIAHYLGVLVLFSSFAYVPSLIIGFVCGEYEPVSRYLIMVGLSMTVGSLLQMCAVTPSRMSPQQALAVTGLAWIVLAFFASIPLYGSGHYATYLDALFDGVSGYTTTGATLIMNLDHLSYADNMFRFMMHLVGGLGLIVVALSFGILGKGGAGQLYNSEARSEQVLPSIAQTSRFIARIAGGFILTATVILAVVCFFLGMDPLRSFLHAFWLSITSFMTGGFAPTSQSVLYYHSFIIEVVLMVLMIFGAINFTLHSEIWKGRIEGVFRDIEIRTMVIWLCVAVAVFAASQSLSQSYSDLPMLLRRGLFMVIAGFSTTGLQNITTNELTTVFTSGAFFVLALIMAIGGGTGSTAGGIKFSRIGIIAKSIVATIKTTLAPNSARVVVSYNHVGRRVLSERSVKEAMTIVMLFVITFTLGGLAGIAHGYEATQAIFESIAMTSNGGLSTIASPGMPWSLEIVYIVQMWAGRLEFLTLLALIVEIVVSLIPSERVKRL